MDYAKSAANNIEDNGSSETGMKRKHKRRHRSAKQVERCRKYRERQSAMIQNNRKVHFDQAALNQHTDTQALVPVPSFHAPFLYITGATPMHQPIYYVCPGIIPPAHVPVNVCMPPHRGKSTITGLVEYINTEENMTSQGLTQNICADNRTSQDFIEIMSADDTGRSPALPENIGPDDKRTSLSFTENLCADYRTTAVLISNISADENKTSPDLAENICADDVRTSLELTVPDDNSTSQDLSESIRVDDNNVRYNQENEESIVSGHNYHTGDEETGPDDEIPIANNDDTDINGIMSIFANSSLHCVLNTTSCLEEKPTIEDFGYAYFSL